MRKVIVSMNITLDGFMAGPNCELDWHFNYWTGEMARYASEQLTHADTILLGRVTYKAMEKYWPQKAMELSYPREDLAFADMMNTYHKVVFSRTLESAEWNNSRVAGRDIKTEVSKLRQLPGKDMIVYGSGSIVSALMQLGLVDEYVLWVHPVVLGKGKPLFKNPGKEHILRLADTKRFSSGVTVLSYKVMNGIKSSKNSIMEKYILMNDIKVFYVTATSFPNGVMNAFETLHGLLPSTKDRKFYGISHPDKTGKIVYKAAVEESYPGEAKKYNCKTFIIPHGEYISELVTDWKKDVSVIAETFKKLLAQPKIAKDGFCLEMYLNDDEVRLLVTLEPIVANVHS